MGILIIYTGGTIGMKTNPITGTLTPFDFDEIEKEMPELKKIGVKVDTYTFSPTIDSSNVTSDHWIAIARVIQTYYNEYEGFVVLHGTDTMSYTASAISFMLENLDKPVVFTGSQIPIGVLRTDGKENLITAIEIAATNQNGESVVPEVSIYFQNNLFRANRTTKHSAEHLNAFRSYNYPPLAWAAIDLKYNHSFIRRSDSSSSPFTIQEKMSTNVTILKLFPGITHRVVSAILSNPELKGVVLESFGSGNAPEVEWLFQELQNAIARGVVILNITQCHAGSVNMNLYDTGRRLRQIGVVCGKDLTTESAVTKLMYLLAQELPYEVLVEKLSSSIRGEMST